MQIEPVLDQLDLLETIRRAYDLPVCRLTFLPAGFVGCHYVATCEDGRQVFLALLGESRLARLSRASLDFTLPLLRRLYDRDLFRSLAPPLRTRDGALNVEIPGWTLIVYVYLPGNILKDDLPYSPDLLARLGRLTGRLHACASSLDMHIPVVETFELPFEAELLDSLADLEKVDRRSRGGQQALRELLLPREKTIHALLSRLHSLADSARARRPPLVLCHTDITPSNLIRTPAGELCLVDWEGAMLAPAEADLCLFTGEGFPLFLAGYVREAGDPHLEADLLAFYILRRNLADLADWLVTVLHENTTDEQDRSDLDGLRQDCLPLWSRFDDEVATVRRQLEAAAS